MSIHEEITNLRLSPADYIVIGSGIMEALGLRQTGDLDLCVSQLTYNRFKELGWEEKIWPNGSPVLYKGSVELGTDWGDGKNVYSFHDLKSNEVQLKGINYVSLQFLRQWKINRGREKDLRDVELIDEFLRGKQ